MKINKTLVTSDCVLVLSFNHPDLILRLKDMGILAKWSAKTELKTKKLINIIFLCEYL